MTTTERTSPRDLRDHFAAVRARRHAERTLDATEYVETNLREILLVEDADATDALTLVARARDLLTKAHEAIERSIAASKRR
jgi:hypothetical protein